MSATYSEKLKSPMWQKQRLSILNRDNFTCQKCNCTDTQLHVHHYKYISGRDPWEYEDDNFVTLCKYCHIMIELLKGYNGQNIAFKKFPFYVTDTIIFATGNNYTYVLIINKKDKPLFFHQFKQKEISDLVLLMEKSHDKTFKAA